jgi:hypothetical protein
MNADSFTKLFGTILTSSIWSEDDKTRIMWITLLACADADGYCAGSVVGFAVMARMKLEDAQQAMARLESPDPHSRTTDHEGRRMLKVDGGWLLVNYTKYREIAKKEGRREYLRMKQREHRCQQLSTTVNKPSTTPSASVSASSSGSSLEGGCKGVPTRDEAKVYAAELKFEGWEAWYDHFESNGWKVSGKAPMKDWRAAMRNGKRMAGQFTGKTAGGSRFPPSIKELVAVRTQLQADLASAADCDKPTDEIRKRIADINRQISEGGK